MPLDITRRDFLGGTALTIAACLTPFDQLRAADSRYYPPALTGLRGLGSRFVCRWSRGKRRVE